MLLSMMASLKPCTVVKLASTEMGRLFCSLNRLNNTIFNLFEPESLYQRITSSREEG